MTAAGLTSALAHQGGWDEILLVLLPIGIFAGLLAVANRRASRMAVPGTEDPPRPDPLDESGDDPTDAPPPTP